MSHHATAAQADQAAAPAASSATSPLHITRLAPRCSDCRWLVANKLCNHPSTPVDVITGAPVQRAREERYDNTFLDADERCGPRAVFFAPATTA